jgi:plasmid maintenance system antidote protein VapI
MNANELAEAMEIRAAIRRIAVSRKSVQEGANDRLADQLEQAANMLRQLQTENDALRKTVDSLFAGLDSSLALNKAQAERNNEQ